VADTSRNNDLTKKSLQAVAVFTVLRFLPSVISIILLPIYLNYLDVSEYGALTLLGLFGSFYAIIACLQLNISASITYFDHISNQEDRTDYVKSIMTGGVLISILTFIIFLLIGPFYFDVFLDDTAMPFYPYGTVVLVTFFIAQIHTLYFTILRNEYRLREFSYYSLSLVLLNATIQYYLIVTQGMGVLGALLGVLASKIIVSVVMFASQFKYIRISFTRSVIREALRVSIPFIPMVFINWFVTAGDKFFLAKFMSIDEVGRYAILINLILLAKTLLGTLVNAFRPMLFEQLGTADHDTKHRIQTAMTWYVKIALIILSGVILVGSNLHLITDDARYISVIPLFSIGTLMIIPAVLTELPVLTLMYKRRTGAISTYAVVSTIVLILLLIFFIPEFGLVGALYSVGCSNLINLLLLWIDDRKSMLVQLPVGKFLLIIMTGIVIVIGCQVIMQWSSLTLGWFGLIQFSLVLMFLVVISFDSLKEILPLTKSK